MAEVEYPDGTIVEFPDDVPKITVDGISARYFDNTQGKFNYNPQPFEHGMFKNPLEGIPEAFAKGIREAPGQLAAIYDQFSPWAAFTKAVTGRTLQSKVDELTGNSELVFNPDEFGGSDLVLGAARLGGNIVGDPLNALPIGMVGKAGAIKGFDNLMQPDLLSRGRFGQGGMIGGVNAKNADLEALGRAQEMKAQGLDADSIYKDTQWWLDHPDGKPRFEIDDSLSTHMDLSKDRGFEPISYTLNHEGVYNNYPDSDLIKTNYQPDAPYQGGYNEALDMISIKGGSQKSTALHELQHAIQGREGMARGGAASDFSSVPQEARYNYLNTVDEKLNNGIGELAEKANGDIKEILRIRKQYPKEYEDFNSALTDLGASSLQEGRANMFKAFDKADELSPFTQYRNLAGEAEARQTQARMNMTMDERLANPFYKNYDVPLEDQIVRK